MSCGLFVAPPGRAIVTIVLSERTGTTDDDNISMCAGAKQRLSLYSEGATMVFVWKKEKKTEKTEKKKRLIVRRDVNKYKLRLHQQRPSLSLHVYYARSKIFRPNFPTHTHTHTNGFFIRLYLLVYYKIFGRCHLRAQYAFVQLCCIIMSPRHCSLYFSLVRSILKCDVVVWRLYFYKARHQLRIDRVVKSE